MNPDNPRGRTGPKPFINKLITDYPEGVREKVDKWIDEWGAGVIRIQKLWKETWHDRYVMPNDITLQRYVNWRKAKRLAKEKAKQEAEKSSVDAEKEIRASLSPAPILKLPELAGEEKIISEVQGIIKDAETGKLELKAVLNSQDKALVLEALVATCYERIALLHAIQLQGKLSPQLETCITRYLSEIRALQELTLKYRSSLDKSQEYVDALLRQWGVQFINAVNVTVRKICPDKESDFAAELRRQLEVVKSSVQGTPEVTVDEKRPGDE